ncbi:MULTISPECIES: hypothetical protein [Nocardia]|uniref:hypothetical protein n=1 Tax=Nocardia TaxID=1817 RepID=UPI0018943E54|nr:MULTISPECIES: hypothetical protein [Nocardia]MBF6216339.1 hypothetical protein [Nocardia puris]
MKTDMHLHDPGDDAARPRTDGRPLLALTVAATLTGCVLAAVAGDWLTASQLLAAALEAARQLASTTRR